MEKPTPKDAADFHRSSRINLLILLSVLFIRLNPNPWFPSCTFVSFVVNAFRLQQSASTTKDSKVHEENRERKSVAQVLLAQRALQLLGIGSVA